jgi:sensor histidine kinase regulating citrate/malate metabolism
MKLDRDIIKNKALRNKIKFIIISLCMQGILNLCFLNTSLFFSTGNYNGKIPIFIIILINALSLFYIWIIKQIIDFASKEIKLKDTMVKLKESNEIISFLRLHKHDFFNHLQVIRGLAQIKNTERIMSYIDSTIGKVANTYKIANIAIPEIAVVIMQKAGEASNKLIKTDVEINTDLGYLNGDPMDYSQILFNLLDNAITALENDQNFDKKLGIIIDEDDEKYYFIIENNFPIIPSDIQTKIFDKGFTTKKDGEGGMGLYIVKSLVEKYKGTIEVISEEDLGTSFEVAIPKSQKLPPLCKSLN